MKTFSVPMFAPRELDSDDALDWELDRKDELIHSFPVLWEPQYNDEFGSIVRGAVQRGREQIKQGHKKVREAGKDVVLTLTRLDGPGAAHLRGDFRYSSEKMAEFLKTSDKDLVPPIIGNVAGMHLLDGHHRWRAYIQANIKPLVIVITVRPSHSDEPQMVSEIDPSVFTKSPIRDSVEETYLRVLQRLLKETK